MSMTLTTAQMEAVVVRYLGDNNRKADIRDEPVSTGGGEPIRYFKLENGIRAGVGGYSQILFHGNRWTSSEREMEFYPEAERIIKNAVKIIYIPPEISYQTSEMNKKRIASVRSEEEMLELLKKNVIIVDDWDSIKTEVIKKALTEYLKTCGVTQALWGSQQNDTESEKGEPVRYLVIPSGVFTLEKGVTRLYFHGLRETLMEQGRHQRDTNIWETSRPQFSWAGRVSCADIDDVNDIPRLLARLLPMDPMARLVNVVEKILEKLEKMQPK